MCIVAAACGRLVAVEDLVDEAPWMALISSDISLLLCLWASTRASIDVERYLGVNVSDLCIRIFHEPAIRRAF
jgi:hypothetical protein